MATNDDVGLDVSVAADTSLAVDGIGQVVVSFNGLTESLAAATAATEAHAEAETEVESALGKTIVVTNQAARAFGSLGLGAGEATERILALGEGLEFLEATAPALAALGIALLAVGAAVDFVGEGFGNASKEQSQFVQMSQLIKNQGGNWDEARESIEKFTTALSQATIFSKGEAIGAIDELISAGISYSDAEKIVAVSTDVASAKQVSLISVVDQLKDAENGRARGLESLDVHLKAVVKSHSDMDDILRTLSDDYNGSAAAAAQTYEGAQSRLRNELELLGTEIATSLLPLLEDLTDGLLKAARAAGDTFSIVGKTMSSLDHTRLSIRDNIQLGENAVDQGIFAHAPGDDMVNDYLRRDATKQAGYAEDAGQDAIHAVERMQSDQNKPGYDHAAFDKIIAGLAQKGLEYDPSVSDQKDGDKAPPSAMMPIDLSAIDSPKTGDASAEKALDEQLKALGSSEDSFKDKVAEASTAIDKQHAQMALYAKDAADGNAAIKLLNSAMLEESLQLAVVTNQHDQAETAATAYASAYDRLWAATNKGATATKGQRAELETLRKEYESHEKTVTTTASLMSTLTDEYDRNSAALERNTEKTKEQAKADAASTLALNNAIDKASDEGKMLVALYGHPVDDQLATVKAMEASYTDLHNQHKISLEQFNTDMIPLVEKARQLEDEIWKQPIDAQKKVDDDDQALRDEAATFGKSIAQQIAYYQQRLAIEQVADGEYSSEAQKTMGELFKLREDELKQEEDAQKAYAEKFVTLETTFVDDIVEKHMSLRSSLKDVWKDILADYEQTIEQMILKSSIFGSINSFLGFGSTGGTVGAKGAENAPTLTGSSASGGGSGAAQLALLQGLVGGGGSAQVSGLGVNLTDSSIAALTSPADQATSGTGGSGASGSNWGAIGGYGTPGVGVIDLSNAGGGSWADPTAVAGSSGGGFGLSSFNIPGLSGGLKTNVGGALAGFGLGETLNGLAGGNQTWGTVGSALGAGVGIIGGPLGSAIGGALGGVIGGLFGPHYGPASNSPDRNDPTYGQFTANWQGTQAGANGVVSYAQSPYATAYGGTSLSETLEQWASADAASSNLKNLPQNIQDAIAEVQKLDGGNANADLSEVSLHNGVWKLANGQSVSVTEAQQLLAAYTADSANSGSGASSTIPIFNVARGYNDANLATVNADGTFTAPGTNAAGAATGGTTVGYSTPTVVVNVAGSVVGAGGIAGVANEIGVAMRQVGTGQLPGGGRVIGTPGVGGRRRYVGIS